MKNKTVPVEKGDNDEPNVELNELEVDEQTTVRFFFLLQFVQTTVE